METTNCMKIKFLTLLPIVIFSTAVRGQQVPPAVSPVAPEYEAAPVLNASQLLKPSILRGPHHVVLEAVPTQGFLNQYTISSDFGMFRVRGNDLLVKRVHEIAVIAELQKVQKSDQFQRALSAAAQKPLELAADLIENPGRTVSNIGSGAKRLFKRFGEASKRVVSGDGGGVSGNDVKSVIGLEKMKRKLAADFKVDPYSDNVILQKNLESVAWAAFAGDFLIRAGTAAMSGGLGAVVSGASTSANLQGMLRDKSALDLQVSNRGLLAEQGFPVDSAERFLTNRAISPTHQTVIVHQLARLGRIPGRDEFLLLASSSQDEADALFFQRVLQLTAQYGAQVSKVEGLLTVRGMIALRAADGSLVLPLPLDYGFWTLETKGAAETVLATPLPGFEPQSRVLYITGNFSHLARTNLEAAGFRVLENVFGNLYR
ncbi:MAG: hypothetical protein P8J87_14115 [Verrucomicrobiales bacterium]|nr:hypothetical protein [Verrucomicrobiales bacterium]